MVNSAGPELMGGAVIGSRLPRKINSLDILADPLEICRLSLGARVRVTLRIGITRRTYDYVMFIYM